MLVDHLCLLFIVALPFLEFGANVQTLPNDGVDTVSEEIVIPNGFPFGRSVQTSAYVREKIITVVVHIYFIVRMQVCVYCMYIAMLYV